MQYLASILTFLSLASSNPNPNPNPSPDDLFLELIKNGDFEDSPFTAAPWQLYNPARNPSIQRTETIPGIQSNAYEAIVSSANSHGLFQAVNLGAGKSYVTRFDVRAVNVSSSSWQRVYVHVETKSGSTWTTHTSRQIVDWSGDFTRSYAFLITPTSSATHYRLRYEVGSGSYEYRIATDNVSLIPLDGAAALAASSNGVLSYWGSTVTVQFESAGEPTVANYALFSLKQLATPIRVPGFKNALELDLSHGVLDPVFVVIGDLTGHGRLDIKLPKTLLSSMVGTPLYLQPVAFNPLLGVQAFGRVLPVGFR